MISSLDADALVVGVELFINSCARDKDVVDGGAVLGEGGIPLFCTPFGKNRLV